MSQDYSPATWSPTTHFWSGRRGYTPRWIIVHGTAGGTTAAGIAQYFQSDDPPTSTHYVIGLNGEVVQCVAESDSAWGNGIITAGHDAWWSPSINPNFLTFSIEHVKTDTNNNNQLTPAQQQASFALIKHLCEKWNIPVRAADANGGITGHDSIDPVNRAMCPGPYPWAELWTALSAPNAATAQASAQSMSMAAIGAPVTSATATVPAGWHDDGNILTAPNGLQVMLGFRWYILHHSWAANNWPQENAQTTPLVDINNPQAGGGTIQRFAQTLLIWEEHTGAVYVRGNSTAQAQVTAPAAQGMPAAANSPTIAGAMGMAPRASASAATYLAPRMTTIAGASVPMPASGATSSAMSASAAAISASVATAVATRPAGMPAAGVPITPPPLTYIPSAGTAQVGQSSQPTHARAVSQPNHGSTFDPLGQRVSQVERDIQLLIHGLSQNSKTRKIISDIEREAGTELTDVLDNPQVRRTILSNPRSILRWVLMILGLLFSDVIAWGISTFVHHSTQLPLPLLTVGTIVSGIVFLGAFSVRAHL